MSGLFSANAWQTVWTYRATFLHGLGNTVELAIVALLLSLVLGMLFGLLSTSGKKPLAAIARVYVETDPEHAPAFADVLSLLSAGLLGQTASAFSPPA